MPTHCCVPECTIKGYREADGSKVSYFVFPSDELLRKKWLHAIRRDVGKEFSLIDTTKVCSRHFKQEDLKKTLAGLVRLKPGAIPSVFSWVRTSPRKRKDPVARELYLPPAKRQAKTRTDTNAPIEVDTSTQTEEYEADTVESVTTSDISDDSETLSNSQTILREDLMKATQTISELRAQINDLEHKYALLQRQKDRLESCIFNLDRILRSDEATNFYTGFPSAEVFMVVYNFFDEGQDGANIKYWTSSASFEGSPNQEGSSEKKGSAGRPRALKPIEEFFLVMCRLRQGFPVNHLGHLFNISQGTASKIIITWINYMYLTVGSINIWPSRIIIDNTMPEAFKAQYSSTRIIIDCTEVRCEMPSSLHLNGELFSSYKNHTTLKGLVGISPGGAMTFLSQLYTGCISDREIVVRSGLLDLPFDQSDTVMADKGFTIEDLLPLGVTLNLPPFLGSSDQMPESDVLRTQQIASLRIHIERAINKIKNFHIWDGVIPLNLMGVVNQMWAVCGFLCNIQENIISI